jgi:2-C-methyl-D-erythritol 4-phosphate cytidylyltransferase
MAIALVVAAGSGERLGAGLPKAFVELGGRPMLAWTMRALSGAASIDRAIVAAPPGYEARVEAIAAEAAPSLAQSVATGGGSRSESVANALAMAGAESVVAVHDAARPLVRAELFDRCVSEVERAGCVAAVAATPVTDTIKQIGDDLKIVTTLDRSRLWAAQTPQVFELEALRDALADADDLASVTDEAQLIERGGGEVRIVEAPADNIKVTTPADLQLAELLLRNAD